MNESYDNPGFWREDEPRHLPAHLTRCWLPSGSVVELNGALYRLVRQTEAETGQNNPELRLPKTDRNEELLSNLEFAVRLLEGFPAIRSTAQLDHMRAVIARARAA